MNLQRLARSVSSAVALSGALLAAGCAPALPAGVTTLLYASPYDANHPFSRADRTWIEWVEKHSGGAIRIRAIWSGELLSSDESLVELRHEVADIGLITPIYVKGGVHLIRMQSGFYAGARTFEEQVAMYRCLADDFPEFGRELAGLHILAVQGGSLPGILTRTRPIRRLADLKGLRIRAPTELLDVLRDLGAAPVNMPMDEVYSALAKGVIDGVVAPPDTLKALRFAEVAKYFYTLAVPRGAYPARAMSGRRWEALPARDRTILEASTPVWEAAMARETRAAVVAGEAFGRRQGIEFHPASPEDQGRFDALYGRDEERNARSLVRYGINGLAVFDTARRIAAGIEQTGMVVCGKRPGSGNRTAVQRAAATHENVNSNHPARLTGRGA
ncbi:MAG: TRAP transporter substrate-binding protein DctP [Steroidobacteraceae bacterium]